MKFHRTAWAILGLALLAMACQKAPTWDGAWTLEQNGQYAEAVAAYEAYLTAVPQSPLAAEVHLRMAHCEESLGDYPRAASQYREITDKFAQTPEAIQAYLALGALYRDRLKDPAQSLDCFEKALTQYLGEPDIRQAIKTLVDAKLKDATNLFTQKDFKDAAQAARAILQTYPEPFVAPDARAQAEFLVDRVERGNRLQGADADQVFVVKEIPFNPSLVQDFPAEAGGSTPTPVQVSTWSSPDNAYRALRKRQGKLDFLYLGMVKGGAAITYHLVRPSGGIAVPAWSPKGSRLVYFRSVGTVQKLDLANAKNRQVQNLYYARDGSLGHYPVFDATGTKIAFVYAKSLWLINANGTNKTKLKTQYPVAPEAKIAWAGDGSMIRYAGVGPGGQETDQLLVLDAQASVP